MRNVLKVLEQIENTSARTEKERLLKENDSELLRKTLLYALDPFFIYGIGSKTFDCYTANSHTEHKDIFSLLDYLLVNCNGSDKDKMEVLAFLNNYDDFEKEFYKRIILKDIRVGISSKTANKVFPNLINSMELQLAKKYFDEEHKVNGYFWATLKLDGIRVIAIKENDVTKFFTRQGKPILELNQLSKEFEQMPNGTVFDGELLLKNDKGLHSKDLYRATMKEVSKDGVKENIQFHMFDILTIVEFKKGESTLKYGARRSILEKLFSDKNFEYIVKVPILYYGNDKSMIIKILDDVTSKGQEGCMVNLDVVYKCSRTDGLLKVKKFNSADVRIVGVTEGQGRNEGKLGALLVEFEHEGKLWRTEIGTGFSDEDRIYLYENRYSIINKIVEVSYFEISQNQKGGYGFRFGVFKQIREDKDIISMY